MSILKSDAEYARFGKEFLARFFEIGYNTYSKTDLQDLILHVVNQASANRFLDTCSNYDLAELLKISETKIKAIQLNIALKFLTSPDRRNIVIRFFQKIVDGKIVLEAEEKTFSFFVESLVERREIENQLKQMGITFDLKQNREILIVRKEGFFALLQKMTDCSDDQFGDLLYRRLKKEEFKKKAGSLLQKIGDFAVEITKDVLKDVIKAVIFPGKP